MNKLVTATVITLPKWSLAAKYDANNIYAAMMYGETRNMTVLANDHFANKTQTLKLLYSISSTSVYVRLQATYIVPKAKDLYARDGHKGVDADRVNYIEVGTVQYYFNKNERLHSIQI